MIVYVVIMGIDWLDGNPMFLEAKHELIGVFTTIEDARKAIVTSHRSGKLPNGEECFHGPSPDYDFDFTLEQIKRTLETKDFISTENGDNEIRISIHKRTIIE